MPRGIRKLPLDSPKTSLRLKLEEDCLLKIRDFEEEGRRGRQVQREEREKGMTLHLSNSMTVNEEAAIVYFSKY